MNDDSSEDGLLAFWVPARDARGRALKLSSAVNSILAAHDYPAPIKHLLAEALVLTGLIGSLLPESDSQLTVQAHAEGGVVDLLVCDYRDGELRGYVSHDPDRVLAIGTSPSLETIFGSGYIAITFDLAASGERYQGIVPLEGASLAAACEAYFEKSEQIPTLIRVGIKTEGSRCTAGGLLVQHYPDREEGGERLLVRRDHPEWQHIAILAGSVRHEELVDPDLSPQKLIWRLFHEESEIRAEPLGKISQGCRCSAEYYTSVLSRFSENERAHMRDQSGTIPVDCAFCSKVFEIDL